MLHEHVFGPTQARVLRHVWEYKRVTVEETRLALNQEPGAVPLSYTCILTVMLNLYKRKLLRQDPGGGKLGKASIFSAIIPEDRHKRMLTRWFLDTYFRGDVAALLAVVAEETSDTSVEAPTTPAQEDTYDTGGHYRPR